MSIGTYGNPEGAKTFPMAIFNVIHFSTLLRIRGVSGAGKTFFKKKSEKGFEIEKRDDGSFYYCSLF